jgi:hypothetical protein
VTSRCARLAASAALWLGACCGLSGQTSPRLSTAAPGPRQHVSGDLSFVVPAGWSYGEDHDGLGLHRPHLLTWIGVGCRDVGSPLPFGTGTIGTSITPQELAELIVVPRPAAGQVQVLARSPARVSGLPADRYVLGYRDEDGLRMKIVSIHAVRGARFWHLAYRSPARHYFDADVREFEAFVDSVRLERRDGPCPKVAPAPERPGR